MPKEYDDRRTSVSNDNDWRKIDDAAERRRAQNRIAQRNYRRNIKLRQQESEQANESSAPRSPASSQRQALRLQSAAMDTSTSSSSSASLNESMTTAQQTSKSLDTFWEDMIATPSLSELATDTEDFEALSLIPSTQENNAVATRISREMAGLPHWIDTENYPTSINTTLTRPARSSERTPLNALQKAVLRGQNSVAKLLAENGADIHVVDRDGNSLLHLAVQSGSSASMLFALRNGIDINRVNALGHTALHVAIEGEDLDAIRLLLGAGADVEMKS